MNLSEAARSEISLWPWYTAGGPKYWRTEPVWTYKPAAQSGGVTIGPSVNYTGPSLKLIQINVFQSTVTWPNKRNVVTVTVFGNLNEEKNTADIREEASVLLPVIPTLHHISARKTASVTGKYFNSPSVCDENQPPRWSALRTKTSVNFPLTLRFVFNVEMLRSVWITISEELANGGYSFYASSPVWMELMFSMVVLMCRDPGDATSKVSCCVEPSWCFKVNLNLKSASFIIIMHLHECLTHIHSQKKT